MHSGHRVFHDEKEKNSISKRIYTRKNINIEESKKEIIECL